MMTDMQEIRARLCATDAPERNSGGSILILLLLAACGLAIGFAALWLMPQVYPVSPSTAWRSFIAFWR
jgi:hypothetical protein